jgi:hypothetical protein
MREPLLSPREPPEHVHLFEPLCSLAWSFSDLLFRSFMPDEAFQRKIK